MLSLNLVLWLIASLIAVSILSAMMRQRRDQLVAQLREYVERKQAASQADTKKTRDE